MNSIVLRYVPLRSRSAAGTGGVVGSPFTMSSHAVKASAASRAAIPQGGLYTTVTSGQARTAALLRFPVFWFR